MTDLDSTDLAREATALVGTINEALDAIDSALEELVDRDLLATLLYDLRDSRTRVAEVYATCEARLLSEAGEKSFIVANLGKFEVRAKKGRTGWKHDELVPALVAHANTERRLNGDTGEVEPEGHAVARVLRDCISFGAGKVTGLKARGFQVDEWCQVSDDGWTVQLPPREAL